MQKHICDTDDTQHNKRTMSIELQYFGPILGGKVDLKPLTLFVGPNGCGKSHAATLLYTISRLEQDYERAQFHFRREMLNYEHIKKEATTLLEKKNQNGKNNVIYTETLNKLANPETNLERMLQDNFGVSNKDLIQKGQPYASLHIRTLKHENIRIKLTPSKIDVYGMSPPNIKVLFDKQDRKGREAYGDERDTAISIHVPPPGGLFEIYDALMQRIMRNPDEDYNVYYFPAERAGLMLAYTPLADYYFNYYNRKRYDPSMPTVATDYLRFLNSLPSEPGVFAPVANEAEKTILLGEVTARRSLYSRAVVSFQKSRYKFPLRMTASSVKDLAAFFLYLKFVAKKNDLVVLEEPETNLHPKNQIELAKFIVQLINLGLYIVLTTHSPYFLEQLSHCIMAGQASRAGSNNVLRAEESLSPDMVAVHKFESVKKHYRIKRIDITNKGIPQDEFLSVDDELYQELSRLRQANEE